MFKSNATPSRLPMLLMAVPLLLCGWASAAETDLSDNPLSSATTAQVKPNILFILDNSGSMNWKFMPDAMSSREDRIGFRNSQCNLVYYNPAIHYIPAKTSTGGDLNSGTPTTFSAAYNDGYEAYSGLETRTSADSGATWNAWSSAATCTEDTSGTSRRQCRVAVLGSAGTTTNLSTGFRAFVDSSIDSNSATSKIDTAQPAYYWNYLGSTSLVPTTGDCEKVISPSFTVNGAVYASGAVTFQTSAAHNFLVGQTVTVISIQPNGYRGTYVVTSVPDTTHFTAALGSNPGGYTNAGTAWNATEYSTINEYCTDNTRTTSTCAALGKTALWRKTVVSSTSGPATADINGDGVVNASDQDERQNFANWYSYYSKRIFMMKAAAGRAFVGMTDSKRIGFITINTGSPVGAMKFKTIAPFDSTEKADWFNKLYAQDTGSSTPLREALSRAGRYFAGKTDGINSGMSGDPMEYSCQQNFAILTTDGYWNGSGGEKLDGTTDMDNQDGVISELDNYRAAGDKYAMSPRPIYDGASTTYTWNSATRTFQNVGCSLQQKKIRQLQSSTGGHWEQQTSQLQKTSGQVQFTTNIQKKTGQLQYQSKIQTKTGQLQKKTSSNSGVTWSATWSNTPTCTEDFVGSNQTQCRINSGTWVKAASCTPTRTGSSGSYAWTGGAAAIDCQNTGVLDGTWNSATTCNESADVLCQISAAATWTYVTSYAPTCTPTRTGSAGSYAWTGGVSAVECQTAGSFNTTWTNNNTCTESTNVQCRINASPVGVPSAQCASPTRTGSPGSYAYTGGANAYYCTTVVTAPYVTVDDACNPASTPDGSGYTTQCQFLGGGGWADASSCTANVSTNCQTIDLAGWNSADICVASGTPDATGQTTLCQNAGSSGFKSQSYSTVTATTYSGPDRSGTVLGTPSTTTSALTDVDEGACYAAAPAVPATADVTGSGPPTPPENCTSGSQVWPCETYAAGAGGLVANVSSASYTAAGADPSTEPSTATFTTSAPHQFLVGHTVTIAGVSPSAYRGIFEIVAVPDTTHFRVNLPVPSPGASTGGGTATLYAGSSNSLADVAQYYYKTDLRTSTLGNCTGALGGSTDVCLNNVPSTGSGVEDDRANWQHMTTFTMGLGLTGTVVYSPNYKTGQCVAKSVASATWSGSVVTVTTTAAHGFYVNEAVTMAGGAFSGYRGQFRIATIPSATTFTFALPTNPGGAFGTGTATGCPDFTRIRSGTMNWPVPVADSATALDDLWHAAVNGRGQYFSAGDPDTVVTSLSEALAGINARVAAAAAAATSNLEPVAGDNFAYTAKYKTQAWTGDLEAREIDLTSGAVSGSVIWSAQAKLDLATKSACDNRNIKLFRSGATNNLVDFKWTTYGCDAGGAATGVAVTTLSAAEQANFGAAKVALLSHYSNLGDGTGVTVDQRTPAAGANLVNYLRGQRGKEGFASGPPITNTDVNRLYRTRENVLGDIINAQPVFVKGPFAEYDDTGYATFKSTNAGRTPMVYSAANDGMLHAVYAGTSIVDPNGGDEAWAFIPTTVLPNLHKLASENYAIEHTYSVDGTPSVGDVYDDVGGTWKTLLVGGLNKGGKGYYALDITDPAIPKALWEFKHEASNCVTVDATTRAPATPQYSDCHLGYTFNNPIISKLRDGRWVVIVTSGYNNVNSPVSAGDGLGYLYVLEAMTGKILYKISTGAGSSIDPSGLNHISGWADNPLRNNQTERVYGVDLQGNVWRFDINDVLNTSGREATRVATVVDDVNDAQPITTRPELAEVQGETFIYVATGRYLGTTDLPSTQRQSVWGLHDTLSTTALTTPRTTLRQMDITNHGSGTSAFRTIACTAHCASVDGWYADLPDTGERVNIDMKLQLGTLVVASNVPESNACNIGGYAWLNYFNNSTGAAVANSPDEAVGRRLAGPGGQESLAVGLNIVRLPSGKTVVIATTSGAQQLTVEAPFDVAPPTGKRVSWREIVQ